LFGRLDIYRSIAVDGALKGLMRTHSEEAEQVVRKLIGEQVSPGLKQDSGVIEGRE
jgi:hypothetical protein